MSAEEFDEIWGFIEQKWKVNIPTYFKNVLKVCGYCNGIIIASIEDDDVTYFESEVRNGNVAKYFKNVAEEIFLKDCTMSAKNFAFTMGHRKWLMTIVDLLKNHLKDNGPNSFSFEHPSKKKPAKNNNSKKRPSRANVEANHLNLQIRRRSYPPEIPNENQIEFPTADLKLQQGILICKAIMSFINITPLLYAKHMDSINKKISNGLVRIEMKKKPVNALNTTREPVKLFVEAIMCCPLCSESITVPNDSSETNKFSWDTANFAWHIKNVHLKQADDLDDDLGTNVQEDKVPDYAEADSLKLNNSTKTVFENSMELISPIETNKSMGVLIQKQTRENPNENINQQSSSVVYNYDTSLEAEEQQQEEVYLEIVAGGNLIESNEEFQTSQHILNPKTVANNVYSAMNSHGADRNIPEPGQYVICLLSVKNCSQWPAKTPIEKNFVGQVGLMKGNKDADYVEIKLLSKSPYSNRIFHLPENVEIMQVPRKKIVKTLEDPLKNRRGEYVFKYESFLDYVF